MCEDISIADDFDVWPGVVSDEVSLLIRPAETNPTSPDIFQTIVLDECRRSSFVSMNSLKSGFLTLQTKINFEKYKFRTLFRSKSLGKIHQVQILTLQIKDLRKIKSRLTLQIESRPTLQIKSGPTLQMIWCFYLKSITLNRKKWEKKNLADSLDLVFFKLKKQWQMTDEWYLWIYKW